MEEQEKYIVDNIDPINIINYIKFSLCKITNNVENRIHIADLGTINNIEKDLDLLKDFLSNKIK